MLLQRDLLIVVVGLGIAGALYVVSFRDLAAADHAPPGTASAGLELPYIGVDAWMPVETAGMIAAARAAPGSVDILVNNAGFRLATPED